MRIVHVCLNGPYNEGWGYHENVIPKYHSRAGHDVTVIAQNRKHTDGGAIIYTPREDYIREDGVRLIRVDIKSCFSDRMNEIFAPGKIFDLLKEIKPEFIMVHGLVGSLSAFDVLKYKKKINKECVVIADTHAAPFNAYSGGAISKKLKKTLSSLLNRKIQKIYSFVYAITPACGEFAAEYYKILPEKIGLLPLGCDPEIYKEAKGFRKAFREKYMLSEEDFVFVHGGKMNLSKHSDKKSFQLIEAIGQYPDPKVKLLLFGSFPENNAEQAGNLIEKYKDKIRYTGMLTKTEYYKAFTCADACIFPGSQSALWQEAMGCGLPAILAGGKETEYLDLGGNVLFLQSGEKEEIKEKIDKMLENGNYIKMAEVAKEKCIPYFDYSKISADLLQGGS